MKNQPKTVEPILWYNTKMGNTVGSASTNSCNFFLDEMDFYILGLWCAEKYHRTSSVGLSNTEPELLIRFARFLRKHFPIDRLRLRIYYPIEGDYEINKEILKYVKRIVKYPLGKARKVNYHLYVNSRPLLRGFITAKNNLKDLKDPKTIWAYFSGRFDGDGSIDKGLRKDCRIVYGEKIEARTDQILLRKVGINKVRIYYYKNARTFCLYISRYEVKKFLKNILPYSWKLQELVLAPRRDLVFR